MTYAQAQLLRDELLGFVDQPRPGFFRVTAPGIRCFALTIDDGRISVFNTEQEYVKEAPSKVIEFDAIPAH
jgi:hypothetical protein